MLPHKFKVGDIVTVRPVVSRNVPDGEQLPGSAERERERESTKGCLSNKTALTMVFKLVEAVREELASSRRS